MINLFFLFIQKLKFGKVFLIHYTIINVFFNLFKDEIYNFEYLNAIITLSMI